MPIIVHARYTLLPGEAQEDLALCIDSDQIIAAGKLADLSSRYPTAEVFGGDQFILTPGYINAHDHGRAVGTLALGLPDNFLELWLSQLANLPHIPPYLAALYSGVQLLRSGVTSVAHSHNPQSWAALPAEIPQSIRGYQDAGIRLAMHPPIVDQNMLVYAERERFLRLLPAEVRQAMDEPDLMPLSAEAYFEALDDLYQNFHDDEGHRVHLQVSPAGGPWCSDQLVLRACEWASQHQTRVQMHLLETRYQRIYAHKTWGKCFLRHLDDIGALGDWLTLAHMVWVDDDDIDLLVERGVGVAHNISSNLRLRSGIAPVAAMSIAGVPIGIGLDGHSIDDDQDFLREMRLAWTIANQHGMEADDLSAATMWQMGTNLAANITFGSQVPLGQLGVGQLADLVLLDWEAIKGKWSPDHLPPRELVPAFLLRRAKREHVRHVMVGGKWRVMDGEPVDIDVDAVEREIYARLSFADSPLSPELAPYLRNFYGSWADDDLPQLRR